MIIFYWLFYLNFFLDYIIYFQEDLMKFLLTTAFIGAVFAQDGAITQTNMVVNPLIIDYVDIVQELKPTDIIKIQEIGNEKEEIVIQQIQVPNIPQPIIISQVQQSQKAYQPILGEQEFNNFVQGHSHDPNQAMPGSQQFNNFDQKHSHSPNGPMPGSQEFNNVIQEHYHDPKQPMPGSQQFYFNPNIIPQKQSQSIISPRFPDYPIGREQFNPSDPFIRPQNNHGKRKHGGKKDHLRKKGKHDKRTNQQNIPLLDYQNWQKHTDKQHKRGKYHKNLWVGFLFVSIIFTLFGCCLSKCFRKCKKNKKRQMRNMNLPKTSQTIQKQIQQVQSKLNQLKNQYNCKKANEDKINKARASEEAAFKRYETQMRQMRQAQLNAYRCPQQNYFYNPQQPYYPVGQIPIGRPIINRSNNSSFASEYPVL